MREIVDSVDRWRADGLPVALATVVRTWGSAPRKAGAKMALAPDGRLAGSVSGGCVEGAVYEAGMAALESGRPELLHFGVADETAWEVGLACGGNIDVFVAPLQEEKYAAVRELIAADRAGATATVVDGPEEALGQSVVVNSSGQVLAGSLPEGVDPRLVPVPRQPGPRSIQVDEAEWTLFIDPHLPAPQLIIVGGVHIAITLATIARELSFRTVVVDPRRAFGSAERFPHADRLIQAWPQKAFGEVTINESTAVVLLTHDPKIDDPALHIVLDSPAFYVGALGSRRTHAKRLARLRKDGIDDALLARIHAPIGVDINAQTPEEIAVAIIAEIIATRRHQP